MSIRKFRLKSWLQPQLPLGRVPAWVALVLRGAHVCRFLCSTRKREVVLFRLSEGEIDVRRLRANQSGVTENVNFSNSREAWHLSVFQASQHIYNVARAVLMLVELFFRFRLDGLVNCRISLDQKFRYIRRSYPKGSKFSNLELVACGNYFS